MAANESIPGEKGSTRSSISSTNSSSNNNSRSPSLRKMKCLSCKTVVFPPVMQCKYWHSVCNSCRKSLEFCPDADCGESIKSATRSTVAEKFLEKYVLRCKYFNSSNQQTRSKEGADEDEEGTGCCMEAKLKEEADLMQAHETICHFREVKCLVPGCYKHIRFTRLRLHFEEIHSIPEFPSDSVIHLNTSQLILKKQILNETCGERALKTAPAYTIHQDCLFLVLFRMTSLRLPVFEISAIVHPYYTLPEHQDYRCKINAFNEEDANADFTWIGPVNQSFSLTPILSVRDELAKLKWIVAVEIFPTKHKALTE